MFIPTKEAMVTIGSKVRNRILRSPWVYVALGGAMFGAAQLLTTPGRLFDDAFFYIRYADRMWGSGAWSFNPGEPAAYGLTGPLHLIPALLGRALFPDHAPLAALMASWMGGLVALGALFGLGASLAHRWGTSRWVGIGFVAAMLPSLAPALFAAFHNGMETALAVALFALWLWGVLGRPAGLGLEATLRGIGGGLLVGARPELALFALLLPGGLWGDTKDPAQRKAVSLQWGATVGTLALWGGGCAVLWGTPLPLSFYVKQVNTYGPEMMLYYANVAIHDGLRFLALAWAPLSLALMGVVLSRWPRRSGDWQGTPEARGTTAGEPPPGSVATATPAPANDSPNAPGNGSAPGAFSLAALALSMGGGWLYHAHMALPIMNHHLRFFVPLMPAILVLGLWGFIVLRRRVRSPALAAFLALFLVSTWALPLRETVGRLRERAATGTWLRLPLKDAEYANTSMWLGLADLSKLPDRLVIATTELGLPAAMNPRKRIIDMAGLQDPGFARGGFDAERLLRQDKPDWIYLPHPHYARMTRALLSHPVFRAEYKVFQPVDGGLFRLGIAIRRSSPHNAAMRSIFDRAVRDYHVRDELCRLGKSREPGCAVPFDPDADAKIAEKRRVERQRYLERVRAQEERERAERSPTPSPAPAKGTSPTRPAGEATPFPAFGDVPSPPPIRPSVPPSAPPLFPPPNEPRPPTPGVTPAPADTAAPRPPGP